MNFKLLSQSELYNLIAHHHKKSIETPEFVTPEDVNDAWGAMLEATQRNIEERKNQDQELSEVRRDLEDLIVTDITYRAAYKFIHDKGMEKEFESYLFKSIDEVAGKVIPFPKLN